MAFAGSVLDALSEIGSERVTWVDPKRIAGQPAQLDPRCPDDFARAYQAAVTPAQAQALFNPPTLKGDTKGVMAEVAENRAEAGLVYLAAHLEQWQGRSGAKLDDTDGARLKRAEFAKLATATIKQFAEKADGLLSAVPQQGAKPAKGGAAKPAPEGVRRVRVGFTEACYLLYVALFPSAAAAGEATFTLALDSLLVGGELDMPREDAGFSAEDEPLVAAFAQVMAAAKEAAESVYRTYESRVGKADTPAEATPSSRILLRGLALCTVSGEGGWPGGASG